MSGETITTRIVALGARGDGVGQHMDDPVFVPFTVAGDRVEARLGEKRGEGIAAELVRVIEPGPGRRTPPCRHFGTCGGCAVQHLDDDTYTAWKRSLLVDALARVGIDETLIAPLIRIAPGTRRRASLGFRRHGKATEIGFRQRASNILVDLAECPVLAPPLMSLIGPLRAALSESLPGGSKGEAIVTLTESGIDLLLEGEPALNLGLRQRLAAFAEAQDLARLSWRKFGGDVEPVAARRPPLVKFGTATVEPPPGPFLQPSVEGEQTLAALVLDAVGKAKQVADLYAGCGSLTLPLAQGRKVHAVESDKAALAALERAAGRASLSITSEARDLERRPLRDKELSRFDAAVFDPPRAGAAPQAKALGHAGPDRVVAVSCNPATLARDAALLIHGGYALVRATPVDQFLWSARLEAVAVFQRNG